MAASNDPTRKATETPPPSGTPSQKKVLTWEEVQVLGEETLLSLEEAQKEQNKVKEEISSLYKEAQELEMARQNLPKPPSALTIFFWGYIFGVLSCIALATFYWLSRKVIVKIGSCTVN